MPVKCIVVECKNQEAAQCKGLCMRCYSRAKKLADAGTTTWEKLESMGLAQLKKDPFTDAFNKLTKETQ